MNKGINVRNIGYSDGSTFKGEVKEDTKPGQGYEKHYIPHGVGTMQRPDGTEYMGDWKVCRKNTFNCNLHLIPTLRAVRCMGTGD